jgi:predicted metalloprotease with PDZ domain
MEGLTSHYDRFALRTSGRITAKSFLDKVLDDWSRLVATPGRRRASLEDSSFDAWIKLYKPDESNLNTTVSYYLKGGLAALALDLEIRRRSEDARSLDDCLRLLWQRHGATGEPHPEDVLPLFAEATGLDLGDTFARTVRGVHDPRLPEELASVGVVLRQVADPSAESAAVWLGVTVSGARVTAVFDGSPAAAGLAVGDELVAIDGWRATGEADARTALGARQTGGVVEVSVFRRGRLLTVPITIAAAPLPRFELVTRVDAAPAVAARYQAWLGEPYPAGETLATVTTTSRAL